MTGFLAFAHDHTTVIIVVVALVVALALVVFGKLLGKIIVSVATTAFIAWATSRGWWF